MPKIYVNVKLPEELAKEIDEILKERVFGYRSRGEFVTEATRTLLMKIKTLMKESTQQNAPGA
jgi:metal-responsive CopG/Arc/MetJ family transcriptional regulator